MTKPQRILLALLEAGIPLSTKEVCLRIGVSPYADREPVRSALERMVRQRLVARTYEAMPVPTYYAAIPSSNYSDETITRDEGVASDKTSENLP